MTSLTTKAIITTSSITITLTVPATTDLFPPLDSPPLPVLSLPVWAEAPEKKIQLTLKLFDYGKLGRLSTCIPNISLLVDCFWIHLLSITGSLLWSLVPSGFNVWVSILAMLLSGKIFNQLSSRPKFLACTLHTIPMAGYGQKVLYPTGWKYKGNLIQWSS